MAFTDHKINSFTHRITDLADQPNMPPDELKARFDACPEELRQAHNAVCDEAARLDERVSGIISETFGDAIPKSMLSAELGEELDSKAVETSVAERFAAETAAREAEDRILNSYLSSLYSQKCSAATGTYTGNGVKNRTISLGVTPKAVIIDPNGGYPVHMVLQGQTCRHGAGEVVKLSGATLTLIDANYINQSGSVHFWLAIV